MSMKEQMASMVERGLRPLRNRVYTMITRAVVETVNDSEKMQLLKLNLFKGESRSDVERFQNFGHTSNPPEGAEAIAVSVGGNRDHLIAIAVDHRQTRVKDLPKGGSAQYSSDGTEPKAIIKTLPDGTIEITQSTSDAKILVKPTGEIVIKSVGDLLLGDESLSEFVALATAVNTRLLAIETKLTTHIAIFIAHVHSTVTSLGTPTPGTPNDSPFAPDTSVVASSKVKVST